MPGGHVSHQIGLDADGGLDMRDRGALSAAERKSVELRSLVRPDGRDVDPSVWSGRVITLLHMAAGLPEVDRILVNPAIKQRLCREVTGDRSWLHLIRPWYGHAAHMHISFLCPAGQDDCIRRAPPPAGDGCDATLQWWFDQLNAPAKPAKPYQPPPAPASMQGDIGRVKAAEPRATKRLGRLQAEGVQRFLGVAAGAAEHGRGAVEVLHQCLPASACRRAWGAGRML